MNIAEALSRRSGLERVRWILLSSRPRRMLRDVLTGLLQLPNTLGTCRLRRVRFRPGVRLVAHYDVQVRMDNSGRLSTRPIEVIWTPRGEQAQCQWPLGAPQLETEAVARGVAAPFRRLVAEMPELGLHVQAWPLDECLAQLVRISDPRYVSVMFLRTRGEVRNAAPAATQIAVTPIRYVPGKRHVLRYDLLHGSETTSVFAKLYSSEKAERGFRAAQQVGEWCAVHAEGVASMRPLAYLDGERTALYAAVCGTPLTKFLRRPDPNLAVYLRRAGEALYGLHRAPLALVGGLGVHDFAAEIREVSRATEHLPMLLPSLSGARNALLVGARDVLSQLPQEPPSFTQGDYKAEHLWVSPGKLTLIDFDSCRLADPAWEVGKFLADLRFWYAGYDLPGLEQAQKQFLAGYAGGSDEGRVARARVYEALELARMAARRVPLFDLDCASRIDRLLGSALAVLTELRGTLGLSANKPGADEFLMFSANRGQD